MAPGDARRALEGSVHYSSKPVSTTASAVGVRLAADDRPDLPFVAFSTLRVDRRICDYLSGGAGSAGPFNAAASVIERVVDETYEGCSEDQKQQIEREAVCLDSAAAFGTRSIDPRLRQVLFPVGGDRYVALSPLHCMPFSRELQRRLGQEKADHPDGETVLASRPRTILEVGGANPQNVGRHVRAGRLVLVFHAPEESGPVRNAFAVYHHGVTLRSLIPRGLLVEFHCRHHARSRQGGRVIETMETRDADDAAAQEIAQAVLQQAALVYREQLGHGAHFAGEVLAPTVDRFTVGLLDADKREHGWTREFSTRLIEEIESFRRSDDDVAIAAAGELASLRQAIERCVA